MCVGGRVGRGCLKRTIVFLIGVICKYQLCISMPLTRKRSHAETKASHGRKKRFF